MDKLFISIHFTPILQDLDQIQTSEQCQHDSVNCVQPLVSFEYISAIKKLLIIVIVISRMKVAQSFRLHQLLDNLNGVQYQQYNSNSKHQIVEAWSNTQQRCFIYLTLFLYRVKISFHIIQSQSVCSNKTELLPPSFGPHIAFQNSFRKRRRNLDPLIDIRGQRTVETMDFTLRTCSDEDEDCPIGRTGDGHHSLGFRSCALQQTTQRSQIVTLLTMRIMRKNDRRRKKCFSTMTTHRISRQTTVPSNLFSRFGPVQLCFCF